MAKQAKRNGEAVQVKDRRGVDPDISGSWDNVLLEGSVERAAKAFEGAGAKVNADAAEAALKGALPAPIGDWLILVELHGHSWMYAGRFRGDAANSAEQARSLAAGAKSRALLVGYEDTSGVAYARVYDAAGKALLDYESDGDETRFSGKLRPRTWLRQFEAGEAAIDGIVRDLGAFVPEFRYWTEKGRIKIETGQPDVLTPANVKAVLLVDLSSDRNAAAAKATAALLLACERCDPKAVREALAAGADVNHVDHLSRTALSRVVLGRRRFPVNKTLAMLDALCKAGVDLNGRTPRAWTAAELIGDRLYHRADSDLTLPLLKALHAAGADLTLSGGQSKASPMTRAAAGGALRGVQCLQELGIDPNAVDVRGNNALQAAREQRRALRQLGASEKELKGVDAVIAHLAPKKGPARAAVSGKTPRGRRAGA